MKKIWKVLIAILAVPIIYIMIVCLVIGIIIWGASNPKSPGRDTVELLGDGTFQIVKTTDLVTNTYSLVNNVENEMIVELICKYQILKRNKSIYLIGKDQSADTEYQYTILNYKTGQIQKYLTLEDMDSNDQEIFENEKDFITLSN